MQKRLGPFTTRSQRNLESQEESLKGQQVATVCEGNGPVDGSDSRDGEGKSEDHAWGWGREKGAVGSRRDGLSILLTQQTRRGITRMQLPEGGPRLSCSPELSSLPGTGRTKSKHREWGSLGAGWELTR